MHPFKNCIFLQAVLAVAFGKRMTSVTNHRVIQLALRIVDGRITYEMFAYVATLVSAAHGTSRSNTYL